MPSPENELPRAQFVKDIFNGIADWVGKYRRNFGLDNQFGLCTPDDVIRASTSDVSHGRTSRTSAEGTTNAADLVLKMLVALHVDPKALENS